MTNQENIFRFISLRAAQIENGTSRLKMNVYGSSDNFPIYSKLKENPKFEFTKKYVLTVTDNYKKSDSYIDDLDEVKFPTSEMLLWLSQHGHKTFKEAGFVSAFEKMLGLSIEDIVSDKNFNDFFHNICDSVFSDILSNSPINNKEEKIRIIKILFTLRSISNKSLEIIDDEVIDDFFVKSSVVFPSIEIKPEVRSGGDENKEDLNIPQTSNKEILQNLEIAHRELSNIAMNKRYLFSPEVNELDSEIDLQESTKIEPVDEAETSEDLSQIILPPSSTIQEFFLSPEAIENLSESSKKILKNLHFEQNRINPITAVSRIENEIKYVQSKTPSDFQNTTLIALGDTLIDKEKFKTAIIGTSNSVEESKKEFIGKCKYEAGIADLLVVKQELREYQLAEIAHVENALAGELKERVHTRVTTVESTNSSSTETEVETERDLQTTERSEMQTESEKILKQQSHSEAGVQITASYGPLLSITASLNTGFSSSIQDSQRRATSFSREISEKTVEKIKTKVTEQQNRRTISQITETNVHKIDNTNDNSKHIRGIYRWLNKIYEAQVYRYDQRMMYEFVIPEPAAFYIYATIKNPPPDSEIIKPEPPSFECKPLSPLHLTRTNYFEYVSRYNVINAAPPPPECMVTTETISVDGPKMASVKLESKKINLLPDYEAKMAVLNFHTLRSSDLEPQNVGLIMYIGGMQVTANFDDNGSKPVYFKEHQLYGSVNTKYIGELSFSYANVGYGTVIGVEIFCKLSTEGFEKWQLKMYDSIMQAYLDQKAMYDARIEERSIQQGVQITGNNPLENRRIEKEELKKIIIMILGNIPDMDFNSFSSEIDKEPVIDIPKSCSNGSYIRFLENAFEWENILYVFYSYFWGRHKTWIQKIHLNNTDSDFAAFLKAGAARVQIPVRPNFEKAVAYFCQTGTIWEGDDVPVIGDKLYFPIINEITENLGKPGDEKPYPPNSEPWDVVVPTSLVLLQNRSEIKFTDILSDK